MVMLRANLGEILTVISYIQYCTLDNQQADMFVMKVFYVTFISHAFFFQLIIFVGFFWGGGGVYKCFTMFCCINKM